jgi:cell division protein FtsN
VTLPPPQNQTTGTSPVAFPGETSPAVAPKTVTPKTSPKVVEKPAPVKKVKVTEYWIQVGSFKDRYQAENTAKTLEAQGLKGTLTTATVAGQAVVRVRVGPYTNEAEAGKFLAWLKPIKEFESSYVTKATALRAE